MINQMRGLGKLAQKGFEKADNAAINLGTDMMGRLQATPPSFAQSRALGYGVPAAGLGAGAMGAGAMMGEDDDPVMQQLTEIYEQAPEKFEAFVAMILEAQHSMGGMVEQAQEAMAFRQGGKVGQKPILRLNRVK